jgi:hypothetical protein
MQTERHSWRNRGGDAALSRQCSGKAAGTSEVGALLQNDKAGVAPQ